MKQFSIIIFFATLFIWSSCYNDNSEDLYTFYQNLCDTTSISYSVDIEPIINTQCKTCHQQPTPDADILLESYADSKVSADNGSLYGCITATNGFPIMPTSGAMFQCDIDKIDAWIKAGTPNN